MREDHIVITIFYAFKQEDYLAFRRHHPGITALHARVQDSINYLQNYVKERESVENITDTISHRCCINYLQNYVKGRESVENITDTISHPYIGANEVCAHARFACEGRRSGH